MTEDRRSLQLRCRFKNPSPGRWPPSPPGEGNFTTPFSWGRRCPEGADEGIRRQKTDDRRQKKFAASLLNESRALYPVRHFPYCAQRRKPSSKSKSEIEIEIEKVLRHTGEQFRCSEDR
jgi:hypothetical protein